MVTKKSKKTLKKVNKEKIVTQDKKGSSVNIKKNENKKEHNKENLNKNKIKKIQSSENKIILALVILILILGLIMLGVLFMNKNQYEKQVNLVNSNISNNQNIGNSNSSSNLIVAKVNGKGITENEFKKDFDILIYMQGIPKQYVNQIPKVQILNQTIMQNILFEKAKSEGFEVTEKQAREELENILKKSGKSIEEFKALFQNKSFTYDDLVKQFAIQKTNNNFINKTIFSKIQISDEEAKLYYDNHSSEFIQPEKIRASHILVNNSNLANEIIGKLNNGGNFSELAKEYSIGPSKVKGGDLGYFGRGQMVPEFENAAFNLTVGEYTKTPIKTQFGYHIILLTDKKEPKKLSFNEVKDEIKLKLKKEKEAVEFKKFMNNLMKQYNIEIYLK